MIGLDTNVVVRFLVNDDPAQAGRARALLASSEAIFIAPTVLLESEWVLRAAYQFPPDRIAAFLRALLGLPGVRTSEPQQIALALVGYEAGMDWADALHLALSHEADRFYTFDGQLRRKAGRAMESVPVSVP